MSRMKEKQGYECADSETGKPKGMPVFYVIREVVDELYYSCYCLKRNTVGILLIEHTRKKYAFERLTCISSRG